MKIELKKPGDEGVYAIADVEVVSGDKGNMVRFTTMTGDELAISESAVMRQLDFCKAENIADLAGKIIHFSRKANKNPVHSPYWNLALATEADIKKASEKNGNGKPPIAAKPEGATVGRLPGEEETGAPPTDTKANAKVEAEKEFLERHKKAFQYVVREYIPLVPADIVIDLRGLAALTYQVLRGKEDAR